MNSIRTDDAAGTAANRLPRWSTGPCGILLVLTLCAASVEAPAAAPTMADASPVATIATRSSGARAAWLPAPGIRWEVPVWSQLTCRAAANDVAVLLGWSSIAGSTSVRSPAPWRVLLVGRTVGRPDPTLPVRSALLTSVRGMHPPSDA